MRQKQQTKSIEKEIEKAWASVCAELISRTKDPTRKAELAAAYRSIDKNFVKGSDIAETMKENAMEIAAWPESLRRVRQ